VRGAGELTLRSRGADAFPWYRLEESTFIFTSSLPERLRALQERARTKWGHGVIWGHGYNAPYPFSLYKPSNQI
jgi:hypothetical protein